MKRVIFGFLILVAALAVAVPSGFAAWFSDEEVSSENTLAAGTWDYPPTVTIISPSNGATVSGTVVIAADATDDFGVAQVDFYVDGGEIGTDVEYPYSVGWGSTSVVNGAHTLTATVTDTAGQTTSASISVTVDNPTPTPTPTPTP